jgi:hypothetical protein
MTIQDVNKQLSAKAPAKAQAPKTEAPDINSAVGAAQQRVTAAKQQLGAINKIVASVSGNGSAKLVVNVRELNAKLAEFDRQLAPVAKQVEGFSMT